MAGIHPRNTIRNDIQTALINAGFIDSSKIIVGGVYASKKDKLPNILVYVGGETPRNLYNNQPQNRYERPVDVFVVIKTENNTRINGIIEAEDYARNCETTLLKPDSEMISDLITNIELADYQVSDPKENSTVFVTQLVFRVKYNDKFNRG
jgi:hypothetical protein